MGMRIIPHNPIHTLETTATGYHHEAQISTSKRTMTLDGRTAFPLDNAAIRERARGMTMAAPEAGHMSAPDTAPTPAPKSPLALGAVTHVAQILRGIHLVDPAW